MIVVLQSQTFDRDYDPSSSSSAEILSQTVFDGNDGRPLFSTKGRVYIIVAGILFRFWLAMVLRNY